MLTCYALLIHFNSNIPCTYQSNSNLKLDYDSLQPITLAHLKQFYSVFILHRRFIKEKLLFNDKIRIQIHHKKQLRKINNELNKNIAHIYYVVSYMHIRTCSYSIHIH